MWRCQRWVALGVAWVGGVCVSGGLGGLCAPRCACGGLGRSARQFRPVNFSFEQNIQTSSWRVGRLCFFCSHRLPAVHGVEKRRPRSQVRGRRVVVRPSAGEAGAALADSAEDDPHGSASNEGVTRTHRNKRRARRSETARIHTLQYDKSSKDCISETCTTLVLLRRLKVLHVIGCCSPAPTGPTRYTVHAASKSS